MGNHNLSLKRDRESRATLENKHCSDILRLFMKSLRRRFPAP